MTELAVVLVTAPSQQVAEELVTALVEERLAACGNIVPGVLSIYRWQDTVERASEVLVVFKTPASLVSRMMDRVQQLHPYDVPEAISLRAADALPAYAAWVADSTTG
jgi:periplasmic divalent cation tolerance protein